MSANAASFVVGALVYVAVITVAPRLRFWRGLLAAVLLDTAITIAVRYLP